MNITKRKLIFAVLIIGITCMIHSNVAYSIKTNSHELENPVENSNYFLTEVSAADNVQLTSTGNSYSIAQITDAGSRVNTFIGQNNRLPTFVTIGGRQVPMSDFLYLMTRATFNLNQGNTRALIQYRVSAPTSSLDQITSGNIQRSEYSNLAGGINNFIESNGRPPFYINSSRGTIGYESQIYLFSRIMSFYKSQGRLPNFASISPWTGSKLPEPAAGEPQSGIRIINAATGGDVTRNSGLNPHLPQTGLSRDVIIAARQGTPMLTFGSGNPHVIIVAGVHGNELPSTIAALRLIEFLDGRTINGTVHVIPFAIPYSTSINSRLWQGEDPNRITNRAGTPTNIILNNAKQLNVRGLGDFHSTQPGGVPGRTSVICTQVPTFESLTLASYISNQTGSELINHQVAGRVYPGGLEDEGSQAGIPSVIAEVRSPHGQADQETIDTSYRQMLAFLRYFNIIPANQTQRPPEDINDTVLISTGNSYSVTQITDAGSRVSTFIGQNNRLPTFVTIAGRQVPMSDFLYLLTRATVNLNQGNTSALTQYRLSAPTSSRDQITSGNIQRSEYSNLAGGINNFIESNGRAPSSINSTRGTISYESQIYLFSRIMSFYGSQGRLPNFASINPWTGQTI